VHHDLRAQKPTDLHRHVALFRRKVERVDLLGNDLDDLKVPDAKAYMTCRAVHAAEIDFNAKAEERNENRSEAKRRAEQFFRIETGVGMEPAGGGGRRGVVSTQPDSDRKALGWYLVAGPVRQGTRQRNNPL
jgi:hypothetical protein